MSTRLHLQKVAAKRLPRAYRGSSCNVYRSEPSGPSSLSISGRWVKDFDKSESMESTCDAFELNFIVRASISLLKTMDIESSAELFRTRLNALGMHIDEVYPKNGKPARFNRRDLRPGKLTGRYVVTQNGHPSIVAEWDEPVKGTCTDVFVLSEDRNTLMQQTRYHRHETGVVTSFTSIHRRDTSRDSD